jgi:hypothetical protein
MTGMPKTPLTLVVRRGALRRFDRLRTRVAELSVNVIWDRRLRDRRTSPSSSRDKDSRQHERRQTPSFTWEMADFVVVEDPDRPSKAGPAK